jgi:hypothetical protein
VCVCVSFHRRFPICTSPLETCTSLEPTVVSTSQVSSFRLQYFPYHVWYSIYIWLRSVYTESFPGRSSKFFLELFVSIPLGPIITGTIIHFMLHLGVCYCCWWWFTVLQRHCFSFPLWNFFNQQITNFVRLRPRICHCLGALTLRFWLWLRAPVIVPVLVRWLCSRFAFDHVKQN